MTPRRRTLWFVLLLLSLSVAVVCVAVFVRVMHRGFSSRDAPGALEGTLATSMRDLAVPARYKAMRNPVAVTPEVLQEAKEHWADHCAVCHANNGSGDTMFGKGLYPRPPDMRSPETQRLADGELYYTINNGVRMSGMPAFGLRGDEDMSTWKLVALIRHLPSLTEDEEIEMQQMNPTTPEERNEEQQEEDFLNGGSSAQPQSIQHTKGNPSR